MEFNEKLQELRKRRGMTQEELAQALFVSRTAISKWESGRGYPNLDSLRQISRFFSVSIDELICPEEIITAAEAEKKASIDRYLRLLCGALDILSGLLLFLPVFGNGAGTPACVALFGITGRSAWIKPVFAAVIAVTVLNGICGVVFSYVDRPGRKDPQLLTGLALSVAGTAVFIMTRQPYAGIICLMLLVIKGLLIGKRRRLP